MDSIAAAAPGAGRQQLAIDVESPGSVAGRGAAARDREIVRWVGRLGAASLDQVRARFALGRTVAYRRVAACIEGGLLDRVWLLHGEPALLRATRRGLRYAGLALPVVRLSPELFGHWLACAWAAIHLAREPGVRAVLSEREVRFHERLERHPVASAALGENPDGSPRPHRADLAVMTATAVIAIELELTPKAPERLEAIVRAWCRSRCVDSVRYYAAAGPTMRGLERAVERAHGEERIELRRVEDLL